MIAVGDGNYDYALLPGFPGDEINCGDGSFTLDSLENKALPKSAMSSCDLSMSLLLGSTISLGTLTAITSLVSAKGTEHMPGNCCMDSPTNSDFFGYRVSIMIAASISIVVS